jgi:hypothetical protein
LNPGSVICYDPVSDTRAWTVLTAGGVTATPAVADERVMAGDLTGNFYIITTSGALLYTLPLDGGVRASPCYANGIAYVATLNRKVYAINVASGAFAWPQPVTVSGTSVVFSSPLLSSNYLFVAGSDGNISAIDIVTGNVAWEWTSGTASVTSSVVAWGPRIYIQDNGNMLRAFSANYDDEPPFWVSDVGITNVEWTGSLGQPRLWLIAGDACDLETPPVKWLFYMSDLDAVDFANPGGAGSSTITFGPYPASITTFTVPEMNRARARWDAHRAWYAARAGDGAIPPNYEDNETTIDYTFPWVGETPLHTYGVGEAAYQFDAAYDESAHTFLTASFELAGSEWKLMQRSPDESPPVAIRLLPLSSFADRGYLDMTVREEDDGMGGLNQVFFIAAAVPIDGSPIRRELWVGQSLGSVFEFEMEKVDPTDHNWGEVSVAVDKNGRPAVACTYMVDITVPYLTATFYPRYHYLDDNDPPVWQHEFIDQTGKQTWYVDLEFKSNGAPVVAYTKSNSTFGGNTGLFVAERNGVDDWTKTPVAGGDLTGTVGKHLSMVLDENDHPVILFTDLQEGMFKLALPTSDGEWNIVDFGVVGNQGWLIHHGTDLVKIDGGTLGALYVAGHFSQPGASRTYQNVFVRAFYKSGANWIVPTDNAYWLADAEQAMDDSCNIVLVERGKSQPFLVRTLNVLFAGDFGKQLLVDSVQSPNILK